MKDDFGQTPLHYGECATLCVCLLYEKQKLFGHVCLALGGKCENLKSTKSESLGFQSGLRRTAK